MREKYVVHSGPNTVLALWRNLAGTVYIGGKYTMRRTALDMASAAFGKELDESA